MLGSLVLTGRRASLGHDVAARCQQAGAQCVFVEADHTRPADCQRTVNTALARFGRIDVLFNNAGIVPHGTAETTDEGTWQATIDLNITAVWRDVGPPSMADLPSR